MDAIKLIIRWVIYGLLLLGAAYAIEFRDVHGAPANAATPDEVTALIYQAAAQYGVSGDWLYAVALCETGGTLRADLVGAAGERGVFQWHSAGQWWATPLGRSGYPIPVGNLWGDISMAAWSFAHGYASAWSCA